jgi:putative restriction endonuclease
VRDEDVRSSCFSQLAVLGAEFGDDVPYAGGLDRGFQFRGQRVPYLSRMKGIHRAAAQRGPAALSITTSPSGPYEDTATDSGVLYAYRAGSVDQADNRALRAAVELQVPLVYFVGTRPGSYTPIFPCFVTHDDPVNRRVHVTYGRMIGPLDEREAVPIVDRIERSYVVRETNVRVHQRRFRGQVLPAYRDQCAICRLREIRLLDAAHIVGDLEEYGDAVVSNGLSLCSIHHRAFDHHLVGVDPDYTIRVSPRLLEDDDGPMLELLKAFHTQPLSVPRSPALRPDRERLATRYERFLSRA